MVHSTPGKGTIFQLVFPANGTAPPLQIDQAKPEIHSSGNETILLLEDEEMVRNLAVTVLREQGYTVLEVTQLDEVWALVEQHRGHIDILLTDVVMPEASGPKLAAQIKKHRPEIRVLFMSGYTDDTVVHHGLQSAQVDFISKPFSPASLTAKVRAVLDKPASNRQ